MVLEKEAFEKELKNFVEKYVPFRMSIQGGDNHFSDKEMTNALNDYMEASDKLLEFIRATYNEEDAELPDMEAYYSENGYHGFAYRLYNAAYKTGRYSADTPDEEWRMYMLCYIGGQLHNIYRG